MNEYKTTNLEIKVEVKGELNFSYGQKLFCLQADEEEEKGFSAPCPICNDTRKVEIKGVELDCPVCGKNVFHDNQKIKNTIHLSDYKIVEYIINEIKIAGPETKSAFMEKHKCYYNLPVVLFTMFTRRRNSEDSFCTKTISEYSSGKNPNPERIVSARNINDFVFTEKKLATEAVKALKKRDAELLKKFNEEHGTSHQYPFEI